MMLEKDHKNLSKYIKNQFGISHETFIKVLPELSETWELNRDTETLEVFWYLINSRFLEEEKITFENAEESFNSDSSKQKLHELLEKKTLSFHDQGSLLIYIKKFAEKGSLSAKQLLTSEVSILLIDNALKWMDRIVFGGYYKYLTKDLMVEILTVPHSHFLEALAIDIRKRLGHNTIERKIKQIDKNSSEFIIPSLINVLLEMFSGEFKKDIFEMRRYVNFLSPFRSNKLIKRLLTILQGFFPNKFQSVINNLTEFFQIKEYEIPSKLIALLVEIIIAVSSRPNIPNKSQYFTQDIMIDLIGLLTCIIRGYFSSTPRELIEKLVQYFDLIVSLNELVYFDIMTSYRELDIRTSRMEAKIIETREYFLSESIFSVQNYSWRTVFSVRIINNKLKIVVTPGRYVDSPIFKRFNDNEYIFLLNLKKIKEDKAELKADYINLIKFYYGPLDIEKQIILDILTVDDLIKKKRFTDAKELLEYTIRQTELNCLNFLENNVKEKYEKYKRFWLR